MRLVSPVSALLLALPGLLFAEQVFSRNGMVATSVAPAVHAGVHMLARGGNAIDAAVATAFAAGVAHQFSSGIGGGGFILVHLDETGKQYAVDARERAPAAATPGMYLDANGEVNKQAKRHGGLSVGVPGLVQGLEELHRAYGKLPWSEVVAPAIRLCRTGVPIGPHHQRILKIAKQRLGDDYPETLRVQYLADGEVPPLGYRLKQPDLARTLQRIARRGSKALTEGPIAQQIVASNQKYGGVITLDDLQSYRTEWREPVRGTYRGYEVVSMPPPSSGGVHLIQMLNALEPFDLQDLGHNSSEYIHRVSEVMKLAFADRAVHLGDPDFYPVPVEWLVSKAYGLELSERVRPRAWYAKPPWRWGRPRILDVERAGTPPPDDSGTTHISVIDQDGNAVAITQTVNTLFGSRITAPGTGVVLNNEMDDFSAAPLAENYWGVRGAVANSVQAGKRPLSSMTPTIVLKDGEPWLVSGSPMGPLIITTVLQTMLNTIDFGMSVQQAVSAPRFHHQWQPDRLALEPEHPLDVRERLEAIGHEVYVTPYHFGASASILRDPHTGMLWGAVDPRRESGAAGP